MDISILHKEGTNVTYLAKSVYQVSRPNHRAQLKLLRVPRNTQRAVSASQVLYHGHEPDDRLRIEPRDNELTYHIRTTTALFLFFVWRSCVLFCATCALWVLKVLSEFP